MARHLRIPVADTVLDANDTAGDGVPLVLLSGQFATQRSWKRLLKLLGGRYRVVDTGVKIAPKRSSGRRRGFQGDVIAQRL
jgi:hypothetical protein